MIDIIENRKQAKTTRELIAIFGEALLRHKEALSNNPDSTFYQGMIKNTEYDIDNYWKIVRQLERPWYRYVLCYFGIHKNEDIRDQSAKFGRATGMGIPGAADRRITQECIYCQHKSYYGLNVAVSVDDLYNDKIWKDEDIT